MNSLNLRKFSWINLRTFFEKPVKLKYLKKQKQKNKTPSPKLQCHKIIHLFTEHIQNFTSNVQVTFPSTLWIRNPLFNPSQCLTYRSESCASTFSLVFRADSDINFEVDSVNSIIFYDKRQQQQPAGIVYSTAAKTGIRRIYYFNFF